MGGEAPEGWRRMRLIELAEVVSGGTPPRGDAECWNGTIPWVTPTEVTRLTGRTLYASRESITDIGVRRAGLALLRPGTVLLTTRATIGAVARVGTPLTTNQGFQNLVAREGIDDGWLYYTAERSSSTLQRLAGGSTFKEVSRPSVRNLELLVPPLLEQRAIAAVLDAVDETIEQTEAVIAVTEDLRKALLHDLLTRGVPVWHTEWKQVPGLGTVPACWEVVQLGEVGKWMSGGTPSKERADYWTGPIPWISAKDMKVREISDAVDHLSEEAAVRGSRIAPPGSIFVVVRGMILAHTFPIAISRVPCAFNQDLRALVCAGGVEPDYVIAAMENRRSRLLDLPTTATHGTLRVITDELQAIEIPLPPPREQREIADAISGVDRHLAALSRSLTPLRDAKTALAEALLSGRVRVKPTAEVMA